HLADGITGLYLLNEQYLAGYFIFWHLVQSKEYYDVFQLQMNLLDFRLHKSSSNIWKRQEIYTKSIKAFGLGKHNCCK
ncbi:hypothetical protein HPG69_003479, partial [Diceros bicornis minor]